MTGNKDYDMLYYLKLLILNPYQFFREKDRLSATGFPFRFALMVFVISSMLYWVGDPGWRSDFAGSAGIGIISMLAFLILATALNLLVFTSFGALTYKLTDISVNADLNSFVSVFYYSSPLYLLFVFFIGIEAGLGVNYLGWLGLIPVLYWLYFMSKAFGVISSSKTRHLLPFISLFAPLTAILVNILLLSVVPVVNILLLDIVPAF